MLLPVVGISSEKGAKRDLYHGARTHHGAWIPFLLHASWLSIGWLLKNGALAHFECSIVPPTSRAPTDMHFMFVHRILKCFHVALVTPTTAVTCMEHLKIIL